MEVQNLKLDIKDKIEDIFKRTSTFTPSRIIN